MLHKLGGKPCRYTHFSVTTETIIYLVGQTNKQTNKQTKTTGFQGQTPVIPVETHPKDVS